MKTRNLLLVFPIIAANASISHARPPVGFHVIDNFDASEIYDLSADGSVAVGTTFNNAPRFQAFSWTFAGGGVVLEPSLNSSFDDYGYGIAPDGGIAVGSLGEFAGRWQNNSITNIFKDEPGTVINSNAFDTSLQGLRTVGTVGYVPDGVGSGSSAGYWDTDGSFTIIAEVGQGVVVDISNDGTKISGTQGNQAFRWVEGEGLHLLGEVPGGVNESRANAISGDGMAVVGTAELTVSGFDTAFRWTEELGMISLGLPQGATSSFGEAVNHDGSIVVGGTNNGSFIWDEQNGSRYFIDFLLNEHGISFPGGILPESIVVNAVSDDGLTFAGSGNFVGTGSTKSWVATIPEPSVASLLLVGCFLARRRR